MLIAKHFFLNPLRLKTIKLFSGNVTINSPTFVNDVTLDIVELRHLARLELKGLKPFSSCTNSSLTQCDGCVPVLGDAPEGVCHVRLGGEQQAYW